MLEMVKYLNGVVQPPPETILNSSKARYVSKLTNLVKLLERFGFSSVIPSQSLLILTWSFVIHTFGCYHFLIFTRLSFKAFPNLGVYLGLWRSCIFLFYPLFNYFGESCWSRYKVMMVGTLLSLIGVFVSGPNMAVIFRSCLANFFTEKRCFVQLNITLMGFLGLAIYYLGIGLFEANSLPLGVNQLQTSSKEKVRTYLRLYVWVVYFSEYLSLPLIYLMIQLGSPYWCVSFLLLSIFLAYVWGRDYKKQPVAEPLNHRWNPYKLLLNYTYDCCSCCGRSGKKDNGHGQLHEGDDSTSFNKIFTLFLTLSGLIIVQSIRVPKNIFFDFDDDWLMSNHVLYLFLTEFLQAIPILSIVFLTFFGKQPLAKTKPMKKLQIGVFLSLLVIVLSLVCSVEFRLAYEFSRTLHPLISVFVLLISLIKGIISLFTILAVLELVFIYGSRGVQGSLLAFWHCYQTIPTFLVSFTSISRNDIFFHMVPLTAKAVFVTLSLVAFHILHKKLSFRRPHSQILANGYSHV